MGRVVKILVVIGVLFGILVAGTAIYANYYVHKKFKATHDSTIKTDFLPPGRSYNILVLGSDRRSVVDKAERTQRQFRGGGSQRADTILLIHVPADQKSAVILSFPRDLRVHIPGRTGFYKINAAYQGNPSKHISGANLMIQTIKAYTGLPVNHYIEVNFASFQKIVDAVGGVRLCPKIAYDDRESGLILKHAGCQTFDGKLALAWVRMRKQDPKGDFGRIDRQQQFIRVLMSKVKGIGFLTDVPRLFKLSDVVSKGVKTDDTLQLKDLRGIANKLAGFKQSNVDFRVVPSYAKYIPPVSWVIERPTQARALFAAILHDTPLPNCSLCGKTAASIPTPADVTLRVYNGTSTSGLATDVRDRLRALGFKVVGTANAPRRDYSKTVILYVPGNEAKALLVVQEFPGAELRQSGSPLSADVEVILGSDEAKRSSPSASP
jgi:LCP family protein required for cell wall assembly